MLRVRSCLLLAAISLVAGSIATPARALITFPPNQLPNPSFDDGIEHWLGGFSVATWTPGVDVDEDPNSGSVQIQVVGEAGAVRGVYSCVPITGGETHIYGAKYFIPSGQVPSGQVRLTLNFYDDPDCIGYLDGDVMQASTHDLDAVGAWTSVAEVVDAPVNADSATLNIAGWKLVGQENQPNYVIYFDDAALLPEADGVIAACATLLLLRRARRSTRTP